MLLRPMSLRPEKSAKTLMSLGPIFHGGERERGHLVGPEGRGPTRWGPEGWGPEKWAQKGAQKGGAPRPNATQANAT